MNTYQIIARVLGAKARCVAAKNDEWEIKWTTRLDELIHELPDGSGFDKGTQLDNSSTPGLNSRKNAAGTCSAQTWTLFQVGMTTGSASWKTTVNR